MGGVESSTGYDSGEGEGFPDRVHCGASWCPEENHFGPRDGVYNGEYEDRIELTAIAHGKVSACHPQADWWRARTGQ
ncbi:hypothetical protein D918_07544 [Trichuris suis]|nr:hypothetical protein D918_07544 [Trichuris suis]